jgi:hypothetical protein
MSRHIIARIGLDAYNSKIHQDHRTRAVRKWFGLYAWFWFHTEFWLEPMARRPYTFIMRDWIYPHMKWFLVILALWYAGNFYWLNFHIWSPAVLLVLSSWLSAHLIWGGKWCQGEQEWPPVTEH